MTRHTTINGGNFSVDAVSESKEGTVHVHFDGVREGTVGIGETNEEKQVV
jgi:hypothetical protein